MRVDEVVRVPDGGVDSPHSTRVHPGESEREEDYNAENEQTCALVSLYEVERDIRELETELARARWWRATLQAEFCARSRDAERTRQDSRE